MASQINWCLSVSRVPILNAAFQHFINWEAENIQPNDLILTKGNCYSGNCNAYVFLIRSCVCVRKRPLADVSISKTRSEKTASKGLVLSDYFRSSMIKYGVVTLCPYVHFHSLFKFKYYILVSCAFNVHVIVDMPVPQCVSGHQRTTPRTQFSPSMWFPRIKFWLSSLYGVPFDLKRHLFSPTHCIFSIWQKHSPPPVNKIMPLSDTELAPCTPFPHVL